MWPAVSSSASKPPSADASAVPSGLLVLHKPKGPTSFQVLQRVQRFLGAPHAGHCGTLDPAASGVLLVLLGRSTRHQERLMKSDKTYSGSFLLGTETDTGDLEGKIVRQTEPAEFSIEKLRETAKRMTGPLMQTPPMHSAVKVEGRPLYKLARRGITVPRAARPITIHRFDITGTEHPSVDFSVDCSSGTYLRTLAEEFGRALGCGAVLSHLVREKVGPYNLKESLSLEEIEKNGREWTLSRIIPV